jgi:hypothetical protein
MHEHADIRSLDALKHAKAALLEFKKEVESALGLTDAEVMRMGQWLSHDRPSHWRRELRAREEETLEWRKEISRKQLVAAPNPASTVEERKKMQKSQAMAERAAEKLRKSQKWANSWEKEVQTYKSSVSLLNEFLHRDIPDAVARLDKMMTSLEEYWAIAAPAAPGLPGEAGAADAATADDLATMARPDSDLPAAESTADDARAAADRAAALRDAAPDQPTRDGVQLRSTPELVTARASLNADDIPALERLATFGPLPNPNDKVIIAARAITGTALFLERRAAPIAGDSGWYIGPEERPLAHGGLRAVTIAELLESVPALAPLLRLAPGSLVRLVDGVVRVVLDGTNANLWATHD